MSNRDFWEQWWSNRTPFVSFSSFVDTDKYDIINGEKVERKDYRLKKLKEEKESIKKYVKRCEEAIIKYSKRIEEIDKELD